ncbi:thy-1 membrane glycoprotein [Xyrauchen texanus]|uniref:thy-1 membrane glycoprotein n=1 Tax=Xyrauchen texanus TaxID=154827 RepID=UPI002242A793|nr:thy-1 membrane glycoprotein [Xyrauchen texanus]
MMCYTIYTATLCLLGFAAAQSILQISSCLTKEQNLRLLCRFTPNPDTKLLNCYYKTEGKLVGSTNSSHEPDSSFKNRATVAIVSDVCQLNLTGFSNDKPQNFTCIIKQTAPEVSKSATVEKSKLSTCSAWCAMQHSAVALLLAFLTFPLMSELL